MQPRRVTRARARLISLSRARAHAGGHTIVSKAPVIAAPWDHDHVALAFPAPRPEARRSLPQ